MVTQFVPAPIAWELRIAYNLGSGRTFRGYDGWKPVALPVIGWEYEPPDYDVPPGGRPVTAELEAWVSYKGIPVPVPKVLQILKAEAATRARAQGLEDAGNISYELALVA